MTNRFCNPDDQYADVTGLPYAGGFMFFYASGTSTPLNTYSDIALTIAHTNPVVLDSAGRPGSVFLQTLAYKVVLEDSSGNIIWTMDPVSTSDFTTTAQVAVYPGNPNGHVAGTAGSGSTPSSMAWDSSNNILYVATTTGSIVTTVWTAVNPTSSTTSATIPPPQGYLTLTSSTPIITSDTTAGSVFYTPYVGNLCPIYNGSTFSVLAFAEQQLTLSSSQTASTIYDVWAFNNSGVFTIGTGPAWAASTAGAGSRGSGAGTSQLQRINGILVNANGMTTRNGSTTYTVAANQATYLGSIFIDTSSGQTTCHRSWGQSRKWGVWNCYNRVPIILQAGDSTGSWSYATNNSTNTVRASNNSTANSLTVFAGLAEEEFDYKFQQRMNPSTGTSGGTGQLTIIQIVGLGVNVTNAFTGTIGRWGIPGVGGGNSNSSDGIAIAAYQQAPALGIQTITSCEQSTAASFNGTSSFLGTQSFMLLSGTWRG